MPASAEKKIKRQSMKQKEVKFCSECGVSDTIMFQADGYCVVCGKKQMPKEAEKRIRKPVIILTGTARELEAAILDNLEKGYLVAGNLTSTSLRKDPENPEEYSSPIFGIQMHFIK